MSDQDSTEESLRRYKEICDELETQCTWLISENARLKAEVERLEAENANNCNIKEYWFLACKSARKGEAEYLEQVARLKAEVDKLTFDPMSYLDDHGEWMPRYTHLVAVERLKAEVERLTKAGDAMAKTLRNGGIIVSGYILADDWFKAKLLTAKEGKGQP